MTWFSCQGGSDGADYVELTQVQYDALSDAEKKNGKMYFITDVNGDGSQFQPVIYSETEREIGVYTDGKPLYEKTYLFGVSDLDGGTQSSSKISGDFILGDRVDYDAVWIESSFLLYKSAPSSGVTMVSTGLNYPKGSDYIRSNVQANSVTGKLVIFMELTYSANVYYPVINDLIWVYTIRYTRSTDAVGSGTWTPQGVPSHHYSTTEQIVGTWIDGKTLYEKTVNFGALPNATTKTVAHNITGVDHIWIYEGWAENSDNGFTNMLSLATSSLNNQWYFGVTPTEVQCWTGSNRTVYDTCYVVLHYTKADV